MAGHTFRGKRKLCYTDVVDYTDFQGIGHDPLYRRYDSVYSVLKTAVSPSCAHFLATPQYIEDEDQICWFVDEWSEHPTKLTELSGSERTKYEAIKADTVSHYRNAAANLSGEELQIMACAIKYIEDDRIYCADDKVFLVAWGMTPDTTQHKVNGSIIHEYEEIKKFKLTFEPGEHGDLDTKIDRFLTKTENAVLSEKDLPRITPHEGWIFEGWDPSPIGHTVAASTTFTAIYNKVKEPKPVPPVPPVSDPDPEPEVQEPKFYNCHFDAGEHGTLRGAGNVSKEENSILGAGEIPTVEVHKGYKFTGWNINPLNCLVNENKIFTAQYEVGIPWYKRWWLWFTGLFASKGCLKWLLWLLLFILGLWLLSLLARSCVGCTGHTPVNGVVPVDTIVSDDGRVVDDNGYVQPITDETGKLPNGDNVVSPVMGKGGVLPPIIEQPGMPSIMANRLFLFLENENDNIEALAQDFKKVYPADQYSIIGYDKEVKLLVIQIPETERDHIRETINSKIPNHKFIVFDEEVYELNALSNWICQTNEQVGWHLDAIHLRQGWSYTKGSSDVRVAIVDDGIQAGHPMFKGRIVDAYNVFTQNNTLSLGAGHGTHTAGLAVGSADYYNQGASGVAPNCQIMPIQVFDNQMCPLSALIAGIMYALHHDADVINVSIGPSFKGLNVLPVEQQDEIARTQFQNVAFLWARVCKLAEKKRSILVFAAGNDDILSSIPPENRNLSSIVVTAVDNRLYPTVFTNYGPCSDVSAPGKGIYSSFPNSTFQSCDGTSMAAPIVSGTVALMKSIKKDLTVEQARNVLFSTGADVYGWIPPMVLVDKALEATKNGRFDRVEREGRSVPDGEDIHLNSGRLPVDAGEFSGGNRGVAPGYEDGSRKTPVITDPLPLQPVQPQPGDGTDYDAIRRKIAEYKQKITELEKLLPKN